MGADYSFYVKTIDTHASAFFKVIIFYIGSVDHKVPSLALSKEFNWFELHVKQKRKKFQEY